MTLYLTREPTLAGATIGMLYADEDRLCYTLEDAIRTEKIPGETAIPPGRYRVVLSWSPHFKRTLPSVLNVPKFTSIRIHGGNDPSDTDGCILVGMERVGQRIRSCAPALATVIAAINASTETWLEVRNP